MKNKEFCVKCGLEMVEQAPITADNFGFGTFFVSAPFDKKTGKKRMRRWIACPKYGHGWGKSYSHDAHSIGKEYLV